MTRHFVHPRTWLIAAVGVGLFAAQALPGAMASAAPASHGVRPNAVGELDCNGYSPIQKRLPA